MSVTRERTKSLWKVIIVQSSGLELCFRQYFNMRVTRKGSKEFWEFKREGGEVSCRIL
jgi:hypothetical protein